MLLNLEASHTLETTPGNPHLAQVVEEGVTFTDYRPAKLPYGAPHPDPVVETASLAAVEPPDVTYQLHLQVRARAAITRDCF